MSRAIAASAAIALATIAAPGVWASGPLGIYGIVERVVFEPNRSAPERVQVWGAFAYVERSAPLRSTASTPAAEPPQSPIMRGYLYFKLPEFGESAGTVRAEWFDLAAVAGTGDAVGFGSWGYIGRFEGLRPDSRSANPPYILERRPAGGAQTDLRVRPATEPPADPAAYQTNAGVVRLRADGSHAALVRQFQAALAR